MQPQHSMSAITIGSKTYRSRLLVGTGKYKDFDETGRAIAASGAEIVTVAPVGHSCALPLTVSFMWDASFWSGRRESNPPHELGKLR